MALQLEPSYAAAAGLVAWCRGIQRGQGWVRPTGPEDEVGIRLAKLAIEFGTNDPDALWMAAYLLSIVGDQTTALSALDRALALNPNSAHAWRTKALCQSLRGAAHAVVAVEAGNRAIRLSPLDPLCYVYKFSVARHIWVLANTKMPASGSTTRCASNHDFMHHFASKAGPACPAP